jgi:hypothetical protein
MSFVGFAILILPIPEIGLGSLVIKYTSSVSLNWLAISVKPDVPWIVEGYGVVPTIVWVHCRLLFWEEHVMYCRRLIQKLINYGWRLLVALSPHSPGIPPAPKRSHLEFLLLHHFQLPHNRSTDLVCADTFTLLMNDEKKEIDNDDQYRHAPQYQSQEPVVRRIAAERERKRLWVPAPRTHGASYQLQLIRAASK